MCKHGNEHPDGLLCDTCAAEDSAKDWPTGHEQELRERFGTLQHQVAEWMTKVAEQGAVESVVKDLVTRVDELQHHQEQGVSESDGSLQSQIRRLRSQLGETDCSKLAEQLGTLQHQVVELQGYRQSASKLDELQRAPRTAELVAMLRANGVTRYRSGDLEIELGRHGSDSDPPAGTGADGRLVQAVRSAGRDSVRQQRLATLRHLRRTLGLSAADAERWLADAMNPNPKDSAEIACGKCGAVSNLHFRGSELLGCDACHSPDEPWPGAFVPLAGLEEHYGPLPGFRAWADRFRSWAKELHAAGGESLASTAWPSPFPGDDPAGHPFDEAAEDARANPAPNDDVPSVQIDRDELARLRAEQLQRRSGE
jgi:hypothetical protein